MPTFEEQTKGYEDSVILGTLVAMWRCSGIQSMSASEMASVACKVALAYGAMWIACMWAAL